jgi:hypothetical protein
MIVEVEKVYLAGWLAGRQYCIGLQMNLMALCHRSKIFVSNSPHKFSFFVAMGRAEIDMTEYR